MKRAIFALICLVCTAGFFASAAAAHHSDVSAAMDCSGKVTYTATAWNGTTAASRTNQDVRVSVSYDKGATFAQVGSGHFGPDNNFSFAGSFSAGSATSAIVKVQEVARWGDGSAVAAPHTVTVNKPTGCAPSCPSSGKVTPGPITVAGSVASVHFTVAAGCKDIQLSLVSYKAPSATFNGTTADQQVLVDSKTQTYSAGAFDLSVSVPSCFYQVDFVYGTPITKLGPAGSNNFYGSQGRLISALNGGTEACTTTPPVTPPSVTPPATPPTLGITLTKLERIGTGSFVAGPLSGHVGDSIAYQLNVTNTGTAWLTVTMSDPGCDAGTIAPASGVAVAPGESTTFTCVHTLVTADGSTFVNTAVATGTAGNGESVHATSSVTAAVTAVAVSAAGTTVKPLVKKAVKKVVKKHVVKVQKHAVKHVVKKVTKKAKPAHPVTAKAHVTG
jgi:hypothetical protein